MLNWNKTVLEEKKNDAEDIRQFRKVLGKHLD